MKKIPAIKKKISAFLTGEEGKMSKPVLLKTGILAGFAALGSVVLSKNTDAAIIHQNNLSFDRLGNAMSGSHSHHASHSNHKSCCFPEDTLISTPKGKIAIRDINRNDNVIAFDTISGKIVESLVIGLESPVREGVYSINKGVVKVTPEHPFYVKKIDGKVGWAAIDPDQAIKETPSIKNIFKLEIGDFISKEDQTWVEITSIDYIPGKIQTYNLSEIKDHNTFFANGLLVHNKGGPCGW